MRASYQLGSDGDRGQDECRARLPDTGMPRAWRRYGGTPACELALEHALAQRSCERHRQRFGKRFFEGPELVEVQWHRSRLSREQLTQLFVFHGRKCGACEAHEVARFDQLEIDAHRSGLRVAHQRRKVTAMAHALRRASQTGVRQQRAADLPLQSASWCAHALVAGRISRSCLGKVEVLRSLPVGQPDCRGILIHGG